MICCLCQRSATIRWVWDTDPRDPLANDVGTCDDHAYRVAGRAIPYHIEPGFVVLARDDTGSPTAWIIKSNAVPGDESM